MADRQPDPGGRGGPPAAGRPARAPKLPAPLGVPAVAWAAVAAVVGYVVWKRRQAAQAAAQAAAVSTSGAYYPNGGGAVYSDTSDPWQLEDSMGQTPTGVVGGPGGDAAWWENQPPSTAAANATTALAPGYASWASLVGAPVFTPTAGSLARGRYGATPPGMAQPIGGAGLITGVRTPIPVRA